jgi:hypothetical protein
MSTTSPDPYQIRKMFKDTLAAADENLRNSAAKICNPMGLDEWETLKLQDPDLRNIVEDLAPDVVTNPEHVQEYWNELRFAILRYLNDHGDRRL